MSDSILPQTFITEYAPIAPPLIRSISELRWWSTVIYLDENPDVLSAEASPNHQEWTWRLERTSEKYVYTQNTYYNGKLMVSSKMDTSFPGRNEFIARCFPSHNLKMT